MTAVVLEQDAAYWEVHVEQLQPSEATQDTSSKDVKKCNAMFGVATKKDRQFYNALEESAEGEGTHSLKILSARFGFLCAILCRCLLISFSSCIYFYAGTPESNGTSYMATIAVSHGDVVGVIMQQSDLPMLQFMLNGEQLYSTYVNRFRGVVYPSLYLPNENGEDNFALRIVFKESEFQKSPPSSRFIPVMVARGLV